MPLDIKNNFNDDNNNNLSYVNIEPTKNLLNTTIYSFDKNLKYTVINGEALAIYGLDVSFMNGKTLYEILSSPFVLDKIPSEKINEIIKTCLFALEGNKISFEIETNENITLFFQYFPIKNKNNEVTSVMVICQDISELKNSQKNLEESEKRYKAFVEERTDFYISLFARWNNDFCK